MVRFGVITNPASRGNKIKRNLQTLKKVAKGYDVIFEEADFSNNPSAQCYVFPLKKLFEREIDVLLINSGDGGHHLIDKALFVLGKEDTPQANLRGGTSNIRSDTTNLPHRNPLNQVMRTSISGHLFKQILNKYSHVTLDEIKIAKRNLLKIETEENTHYGFIYSSGLVTNFLDLYYSGKSNHAEVFSIIFRGIKSVTFPFLPDSKYIKNKILAPASINLSLDGENLEGDAYKFVMVTSMDYKITFGPICLKLHPTLKANETEELRYMASQNLTFREAINQVPKIFSTPNGYPRELTIKDLDVRNTSEILINPKSLHTYTVDGEIYKTNGEIKITPTKQIPFLCF